MKSYCMKCGADQQDIKLHEIVIDSTRAQYRRITLCENCTEVLNKVIIMVLGAPGEYNV